MNYQKIIGIMLIAGALIGIAYFLFMGTSAPAPITPTTPPAVTPPPPVQTGLDPKNATYVIASSSVTLTNGVSVTEAAPGSASKITTRYFGNDATGDLNGDGLPDTAFLITQDTGGSGLFYYAVVAMKTTTGYKMTNAFLIGDRIAPQSTEINSSAMELRVNYAERKPGEPMTAQPSQGATLFLKVTPDGVLNGLMQ